MAIRSASFDDGAEHSFEEEWPEIARRLERYLAARGVERWLRADVIQETATRLYPRWETLDHSLPLWNLVVTIAVRVVHNYHRKQSRIELVPDPVPIHKDDVHVRGLQRAQLAKTRSALQHLTTDQRRVLLAEVGEALLPAGTRNRINVLRLRARARLREALGPWAPSGITVRLRYLRERVAQKRSSLEMHLPAMTNSLVTIATAATVGLAGAAIAAANPVRSAHARFPSVVDLRDAGLDPIASIRRPKSPNLFGAKDRAKKTGSEAPRLVANPREWVEDKKEWAEDKANDKKQTVEDKKETAEDKAKDKKETAEDKANDKKKWAEDKLP